MEQLLSVASQYGIVGLTLFACGFFIVYRDKVNTKIVDSVASGHANERKEWRQIIDRQHIECIQARHEATQAVVENSVILSKLSTLIDDRRK